MGYKKFASPMEEALEIAYQTRKDILQGKQEASSILRACLVVAENLNKIEMKNWIDSELRGYSAPKKIPWYRKVNSARLDRYDGFLDFYELNVHHSVHLLSSLVRQKNSLRILLDEETREVAEVSTQKINGLLNAVVDKCLSFLNGIITELQYGGIVEYLMEEIRKNTDEKLAKLDTKLTDETQSLFVNLTSTNPADWNKVGHSCRKILKLLADKVLSPSDESYTMKDGRKIKIGDPQFINRLCAFFDQKVAGEERKFLCAEIEYLESYLRQVVEYAQMGEHKPSIEKHHADMIAIHTYLIISEVLKHKD